MRSDLARVAGGARIAQFWGDIDRDRRRPPRLCRDGPRSAPEKGHMGILLNALGPEPIIRLQAGGLKAAEFVWRGNYPGPGAIAELV